MDISNENKKVKNAKKMLVWFGIISITMTFAGLTSAYVVSSSSRPDWLFDLQIPTAFFISTATLLLSSLCFFLAVKAIRKDQIKKASALLWLVFLLGLIFIGLQISGFYQFISEGYYFTGSESNITISYIYIIAFLHILHIIAGLIVILTVIYQNHKHRYSSKNYQGAELGALFWHFLDFLWLYLILFFYFYR